jgi:hypothetical protein
MTNHSVVSLAVMTHHLTAQWAVLLQQRLLKRKSNLA